MKQRECYQEGHLGVVWTQLGVRAANEKAYSGCFGADPGAVGSAPVHGRHKLCASASGCAEPTGPLSFQLSCDAPSPPPPQPVCTPGTCVGAREGAEEPRVLVMAIVHLHHIVEGRVEEGELSKHDCEDTGVEVSAWKAGWTCWG